MTRDEWLKLVAEIAEDLFTNGSGDKADRLVLMTKDGRNLGGWGERPMADRLLTLLKEKL